MHKHWVISSLSEKDEVSLNPLFWSNEQEGWVIMEDATIFSDQEKTDFNLPESGNWIPVSDVLANETIEDPSTLEVSIRSAVVEIINKKDRLEINIYKKGEEGSKISYFIEWSELEAHNE